jgi:hypothetical protein
MRILELVEKKKDSANGPLGLIGEVRDELICKFADHPPPSTIETTKETIAKPVTPSSRRKFKQQHRKRNGRPRRKTRIVRQEEGSLSHETVLSQHRCSWSQFKQVTERETKGRGTE